jgi:hypothetical protein
LLEELELELELMLEELEELELEELELLLEELEELELELEEELELVFNSVISPSNCCCLRKANIILQSSLTAL